MRRGDEVQLNAAVQGHVSAQIAGGWMPRIEQCRGVKNQRQEVMAKKVSAVNIRDTPVGADPCHNRTPSK